MKDSTLQMAPLLSMNPYTFIKGIWRTINNSITNETNWLNGSLWLACHICKGLILYSLDTEHMEEENHQPAWRSNGYNHPRYVDVLLATFLATILCFCFHLHLKYLYLFSGKKKIKTTTTNYLKVSVMK